MYTYGIHVNKFVWVFFLVDLSFVTGVSAKNSEG